MKPYWEEIVKDFLCVRSFITLGAFGIAYYLSATAKPVPDLLIRIIDLLLGFWFGQKAGQIIKNGGEQK